MSGWRTGSIEFMSGPTRIFRRRGESGNNGSIATASGAGGRRLAGERSFSSAAHSDSALTITSVIGSRVNARRLVADRLHVLDVRSRIDAGIAIRAALAAKLQHS